MYFFLASSIARIEIILNNMDKEKVIAYKGFNKDLTCRGFQYEVGKEYEEKGISICNRGFHACPNPFDVIDFYGDINNRFCKVEQSGQIEKDEKKQVSSKIKVIAEIGFAGLFKAGVEWIKEITKPESIIEETKIGSSGDDAKIGSSGNYAQIGSSGYGAQIGSSGYDAKIGSSGNYAKIGSSGDGAQIGSSGDDAQIGSSGNYAKIGSSGDGAQIDSTGEDSIICCAGNESAVRAKKGSWITLSEWGYSKEKGRNVPVCVKTEYVDGEKIKEDTWYKLVNGNFVEVL